MLHVFKKKHLSIVDYSCDVTCKRLAGLCQFANLESSCQREDR